MSASRTRPRAVIYAKSSRSPCLRWSIRALFAQGLRQQEFGHMRISSTAGQHSHCSAPVPSTVQVVNQQQLCFRSITGAMRVKGGSSRWSSYSRPCCCITELSSGHSSARQTTNDCSKESLLDLSYAKPTLRYNQDDLQSKYLFQNKTMVSKKVISRNLTFKPLPLGSCLCLAFFVPNISR